jgi:diacylglycerol kinase family enzyme
LARNFLKKGFKNIVAIGGDGTINEVANRFFEKEESTNIMEVVATVIRGLATY